MVDWKHALKWEHAIAFIGKLKFKWKQPKLHADFARQEEWRSGAIYVHSDLGRNIALPRNGYDPSFGRNVNLINLNLLDKTPPNANVKKKDDRDRDWGMEKKKGNDRIYRAKYLRGPFPIYFTVHPVSSSAARDS